MPADLATVTTAAILARGPCPPAAATGYSSRGEQLSALCQRYRRETWSALEILSVDDVSAEDRLWVCLDESLVPRRVLVRFACEVAAEAMRLTGWTDPRSWDALHARLAYERGEIDDAARAAAWDAAGAAARDAARAAAGAAARAAAWDAAWAAAWNTAWAAAWAAAGAARIVTLRTLILLDLDGHDVLSGELGGVVPRKAA